MYDYLIVGSGIFGAVFAHEARRKAKSVLVIDKRPHIGGNCYTEKREGVDVHVYGPHIFHTSDEKIWKFVNQFTNFNNYVNRPKVNYRGRIFSFPINLMTLHQLWGVNSPQEAQRKLDEVRVPCENPRNLEEWILSQVGQEVYETFIHGYTTKQWMREPKDLPASIIKRLPIRLNFDDNYFNDRYQGIPVGGYTEIFKGLLQGCDIALGEDFFENRAKWEGMAKRVVFTGKIDEYFGYEHGELDYRTLRFEHNSQDGDFQGNAVVNYTDAAVPYTRITEHKYFQPQDLEKTSRTIWTKEFPAEWHRNVVPYYPIGDEKNNEVYRKYKEIADNTEGVLFGGRLAEYKYYDMHQVIGSALQKSRREIGI
jgi:UDP-galactopyranose mutase